MDIHASSEPWLTSSPLARVCTQMDGTQRMERARKKVRLLFRISRSLFFPTGAIVGIGETNMRGENGIRYIVFNPLTSYLPMQDKTGCEMVTGPLRVICDRNQVKAVAAIRYGRRFPMKRENKQMLQNGSFLNCSRDRESINNTNPSPSLPVFVTPRAMLERCIN